MRSPPPAPGHRARTLAAVVLLSGASGLACAAPGESDDAIARFLAAGVTSASATVSAAGTTSTAAPAPALTPSAPATSPLASSPSPGETPTASGSASVDSPGILRRVNDRAAEAVISALNYLGVPYRRGGNSAETGFDCSGFTRYIFEHSLGLMLPRQAEQQARAPGLVAVRREDLQPGDLVFFRTMKRTFSHVGIYIGDNRFIHAPSRGKDIRTDSLGFAYWAKRFTGARRAELPLIGTMTSASTEVTGQ